MKISYDAYTDKVLGGWIGKCIGGTIGARFEGDKNFIEIPKKEMFPDTVPPNDDLDLQVLWLKVLEEKGADITSSDMADAWLNGCWYPFNEYGIFRRNYRLGIKPPLSGAYGNQFWETGMGCPIRAEIWGYAFPGAPDLAASYSRLDGVLDHTEQSVGAEEMFAAMASMAFFVDDWRELAFRFMHYLPAGSPIERMTREAFRAHDEGLSLREARERIILLAGTPEACDSQINVPFTFLGLLYGGGDLEDVMAATLSCGYDTDCTMATAGALVGQILGAGRIAQNLKDQIGDELVMGIEYRRPDMTISALTRDTVRVGIELAKQLSTGFEVTDAPELAALPPRNPNRPRLAVHYHGLPCAAPGDTMQVTVTPESRFPADAEIGVQAPAGFTIVPQRQKLTTDGAIFTIRADENVTEMAYRNSFAMTVTANGTRVFEDDFGIAGAGLWRLLTIGYDAVPADTTDMMSHPQRQRRFNHHFLDISKPYLANPWENIDENYKTMSRLLGRPALVPSYENEVDVSRLVGLSGVYSAYLARKVVVPEARALWIVVGHTSPFAIWLNGELVGEETEHSPWTPFNRTWRVPFAKGENTIVVRLNKTIDTMRFTLALRESTDAGAHGRDINSVNAEDWFIDFSDVIPS